MQVCLWICVVLFATTVSASERMTVSICTRGSLDQKVVAGAEAAAAALFRSIDIEIVWAKCEIGLEGDAAARQHWFTVRLRDGKPFITPGPAALDTLGEAFLPVESAGYIADVYYQVVQALATAKQVEFTPLSGYVIAHELGHLLLGPGHAATGVMRAAWDLRDLEAIRRGRLKFTPAEGARMRNVLQAPVGFGVTPLGAGAKINLQCCRPGWLVPGSVEVVIGRVRHQHLAADVG